VELPPEVVGGPGATRNPLVNPHDFHQKMAISGGLTNGFLIQILMEIQKSKLDGNPFGISNEYLVNPYLEVYPIFRQAIIHKEVSWTANK